MNAYSGLYFFRGSGAASVADISTSGPADEPGLFTAYPFGKKSGFSYAFELQAQRVTKGKHLFGAGVGFEELQSKVGFTSVQTQVGNFNTKGTVDLTNTSVTINPYIGQRFAATHFSIDVTAGIDVAFSTKVYEKAAVKLSSEQTYSNIFSNYPVDIRPRVQISSYYKRFGLLAGYSIGTQDFFGHKHGYDYLNETTYANFLRFGLSYRLR